MGGRNSAGDFKDPHELAVIGLAITKIVERVFRREAERVPHTLGNERVKTGTLVNLIEMRQRLFGIKHASLRIFHGRPIRVIQQTFD
jgi:hypothetical protein